ncbi:hypothetical protein ANTRET_LOCUS316 [Anthophora retusa]
MEVLATLLSLLCVSTAPVESLPELKLLQIVFAHKTFAPILDLIKSNETDLPRTLTYRHFVTAPLDMPNVSSPSYLYDFTCELIRIQPRTRKLDASPVKEHKN